MDQLIVDLRAARNHSAPSADAHGRAKALETNTLSLGDPQEILVHPALDTSEKRALLASWASDACAVENLPNWRKLPETGALVPLDDILDALQALDGGALH
jgi:hypothetical protein